MDPVLVFVFGLMAACAALGGLVKWNLDRKHKQNKKLSKKQKRELMK